MLPVEQSAARRTDLLPSCMPVLHSWLTAPTSSTSLPATEKARRDIIMCADSRSPSSGDCKDVDTETDKQAHGIVERQRYAGE